MSKTQGSDTKAENAGTKGQATPARSSQEGGSKSRFAAFRDYLVLSRAELRKVSWPTWKETRATTLVVLGFVAVMAVLLGVVDLVLAGIIGFILS